MGFSAIHMDTTLKVALKQQSHFRTSSKDMEFTKSGEEHHSWHAKSLKGKLSGCGVDTFKLVYPINLSNGKKMIKMLTIICATLKC